MRRYSDPKNIPSNTFSACIWKARVGKYSITKHVGDSECRFAVFCDDMFFFMVESTTSTYPNRLPVADFQGDGTDRGILICEGAALMLNKALPTKTGIQMTKMSPSSVDIFFYESLPNKNVQNLIIWFQLYFSSDFCTPIDAPIDFNAGNEKTEMNSPTDFLCLTMPWYDQMVE